MNLENFKKGIFQLPHKRFGTLCQIMINKLFIYSSPINNYHDLFDNNYSHRIEIKFSIVREKWKTLLKEDNVIECIENSFDGNKIIAFKDHINNNFDCSMNHVKPAEFDRIYYGLFFEDQILIFTMKSNDIGCGISYCDKQQKGGVGEGQFHISNKNKEYHLKNYFCHSLNYEQLYELFKKT